LEKPLCGKTVHLQVKITFGNAKFANTSFHRDKFRNERKMIARNLTLQFIENKLDKLTLINLAVIAYTVESKQKNTS